MSTASLTGGCGDGAALGVLTAHGRSFRFAGRFLPADQLESCARLYRFCRLVDDTADGPGARHRARRRLDDIRDDLLAGESADPRLADFLDLAARHRLDLRLALELIDGVRGDLGRVRIATDAELKRYAYRVAGTVGLLMCGVLDVRERRAFPHAVDLGIAMQLTNIARDVSEDARAGRIYLPVDWLGPVPVDRVAAADDPVVRARLRATVRRLLAEAERYYRSGEAGLTCLAPRARLAILVAARVYREIGNEIARRDFATWRGRAVVPGPRKLLIAARSVADHLRGERRRGLPRSHDRSLHRHLGGLPGCAAPGS